MADGLWQWGELVLAAGGRADVAAGGAATPAITGVSIDTRTLAPGDLFVALKDVRDGHDFVTSAFAKGAAAALVADGYRRQLGDGTLLRVTDPLAALVAVAIAARARLAPAARVVAITGSAGKTGTKEMLKACLATAGGTHASEKSYNNHWGVPLTLARMPADTRFAVIEIGMNHAGEITPLARMARPHAAIITNVLPVHLGQFPNEEAIADAKAEILLGVVPEGTAILNADNRHFTRLADRAGSLALRVRTFGADATADIRAERLEATATGTHVEARIRDDAAHAVSSSVAFDLGAPGAHLALNALGVVAALHVLGVPMPAALAPLAGFSAPVGRGARSELPASPDPVLLIDESYNANPASVKAALMAMTTVPRGRHPRRIAVLGQMLELGPGSRDYHLSLSETIDAAGVDLVLACGPDMRALLDVLPPSRRAAWSEASTDLIEPLLAIVRPGDVVMIKGSLGTRMAPLVEALKRKYHA